MDKKTRKEIGTRLKDIRIALKLSQEEFASKLGVARSSLYRSEKGECILPMEGLQELAKGFNVSLNWILVGLGEMFMRKPTGSEEALAFVMESNEMEELLLLMQKLPLFKYSILQHFFRFKTDNPQLIIEEVPPPINAVA